MSLDSPVVLENFISAEIAEKLAVFLLNIEKQSPRSNHRGSLGFDSSLQASKLSLDNPVIPITKNGADDLMSLTVTEAILNSKSAIEQHYGLDLDLVQAAHTTIYAGPGIEMHSDSTQLDGSPLNEDGTHVEMEYSAILYLNSCGVDYEGGEIYFPKQNMTYSPARGSLIHFKGDSDRIHMVKDVLSGKRIAIIMFFSRRGNVSMTKFYH